MAKYTCWIVKEKAINTYSYYVRNNNNELIVFNSTFFYNNEYNGLENVVRNTVISTFQTLYGIQDLDIEFIA